MKIRFTLLILLFIGSLSSAQNLKNNYKLKIDIEDIADYVGSRLMRCCSSFGGNDLSTTVYWDKDKNGKYQTRINSLTNKLTITLKVTWYGSLSGRRYWIKGKAIVDPDKDSKKWIKISDSGGFPPNCGTYCNID